MHVHTSHANAPTASADIHAAASARQASETRKKLLDAAEWLETPTTESGWMIQSWGEGGQSQSQSEGAGTSRQSTSRDESEGSQTSPAGQFSIWA